MRIISTICLLLVLMGCGLAGQKPESVKIGVLAYRGNANALSHWGPTVDYLQQQLPQYDFILIPLDLVQMQQAVKRQELEFVLTNTGNYLALKNYGLEPITSLRNLINGKPYSQFGAVIFTRADRDDINTISDLKNKRFAAVSRNAFGGFQMAWLEMLHHGVDPFKDLAQLEFSGFPQDKIVLSVINGTMDAGTVRTDTIEQMERDQIIDTADLKVLNQQFVKGFPFRLSTGLYPEWPFLKTRHTSQQLADQVRSLLVAIKPTDTAARLGEYYGWNNPADLTSLFSLSINELMEVPIEEASAEGGKYHSIDELMKELQIGPYEKK